MRDPLTLAASNDAPIKAEISIYSAEKRRIILTPSGLAMSLTISKTPQGAPLVELPSEAGGSQFLITPDDVSPLTEDASYWLNIWNVEDEDDPIVLVTGRFKLEATIQPAFVDYPTLVFQGATIVRITQVDYDALVSPEDDDVIYVIRAA